MADDVDKVDLLPVERKPKLVDRDRITIIANVNHEHFGDDPFSKQAIFSKLLDTKEQPYSRRVTITEEWAPLDFGWVKQVGLVFLQSRVGRNLQINPTEEEKKTLTEQVVEVSQTASSEECELVYPGGFYLGFPANAARLQVRSRKGSIEAWLTALPL